MANSGIYSALSGAMAQSQRLDTIANNLANANTPAFKRDQNVFKEYLTANEKPPEVIRVPRIPASIESFYDLQGGDKGYVDNVGSFTDHSQGGVKVTGNPLDLAIEGRGFFEVLTPQGVMLSRNGAFKVSSDGFLVNAQGHPVLAEGTAEPENRRIQIQGGRVTVSYAGDVIDRNANVAKLSVVDTSDVDSLQKMGSSLFTIRPNFDAVLFPSDQYKIHQNSLETSNVNVVKEMTDMISASRTFESNQKAIKAFDQMSEKLINEVPRL